MNYNEKPKSSPDSELRKRHRGSRQEAKEKTRQFIDKAAMDNSTSKKRLVILTVGSLWLLFILYRVYTTFQDKNFNNLSIIHFISTHIR